jgi:hypothetical protein
VSLECLLQARPPVHCRQVCMWANTEDRSLRFFYKIHGYVIGGHRSKLHGYSAFERLLVHCVSVSIDIPFPWNGGSSLPIPLLTEYH